MSLSVLHDLPDLRLLSGLPTTAQPVLAPLTGGRLVAAWTSGTEVKGKQVISAVLDGSARLPSFQVVNDASSDLLVGPKPAVVGLDGGGYVVSWTAYDRFNENAPFTRIYGPDLAPITGPTVIFSDDDGQTSPSLTALPGNRFAAAYQETPSNQIIAFNILVRAGSATWVPDLPNLANKGPPVMATINRGESFVVLTTVNGLQGGSVRTNDIYGALYRADGTGTGISFPINRQVIGDQDQPAVAAFAGGAYVVAFVSDDMSQPGSRNIMMRTFTGPDSSPPVDTVVTTRGPGQVQAPQVVGLNDGGFLITWTDTAQRAVFGQRYDFFEREVGGLVRLGELGAGAASPQTLAMSDGRILLVETSQSSGLQQVDGKPLTVGSHLTVGRDLVSGDGGEHLLLSDPDGLGAGDVIDAGAGRIVIQLNRAGTLNLAAGATIDGVDELRGSSGSDRLIGNASGNILAGGLGRDVLTGGEGQDTFRGTAAEMAGDTISDMSSGERIELTAGRFESATITGTRLSFIVVDRTSKTAGEIDLNGRYGTVQLDGPSVLVFTSVAAPDGPQKPDNPELPILVGFESGDQLTAGEQGAWIFGLGGSDLIKGGAGSDILFGGSGPTNPIDAGDLIIGEGGSDLIYGNGGDDLLYAGQGQDTVYGGVGNDTVYGGNGLIDPFDAADTIYGGQGSDTLYGNGGDDVIYGGTGFLDPLDAADVIYGGAGSDVIYGNGGDDTLVGGTDNDTLYGGAGVDKFVFNPGDGFDTIFGFSAADGDRLLVAGQTFTTATVDGGTLITLSGGGTVLLADMALQSVGPDLFV